jgi:hypothetical protein
VCYVPGWAAHGDSAAVGIDVDTSGSSLSEDETHIREDETHFTLDSRVECRTFVSERILVGLHWHSKEAIVFFGFPMSLNEAKTKDLTVKAPRGIRLPGHKGCAIVIAV